jgi:hypothetical protein
VRMYISVGPGGSAASNFVLGALVAGRTPSGRSFLATRVRDSGGGTLDLNGAVTLSRGPGGLRAGPFDAKLGALLSPGSSEAVSVTLGAGFPRGPWRADLTVKSGTLSRSTVDMIMFPSGHLMPNAKRSTLPTPLLLALLASLIVLVLAFMIHRRPRLLRVLGLHWRNGR